LGGDCLIIKKSKGANLNQADITTCLVRSLQETFYTKGSKTNCWYHQVQ
jgi:hypothetical protein